MSYIVLLVLILYVYGGKKHVVLHRTDVISNPFNALYLTGKKNYISILKPHLRALLKPLL